MDNGDQVQTVAKFNCEKCRFSTKDQHKYNNHVTLHNDIKFSCSHCNYVSYTKGDFQRHLVTHTGKFPYTCEYCGYGAVRNDYIVKHIKRIHNDGKIQCSVSIVENDAKNTSVNIIETNLPCSVQEIAPSVTFSTTEGIIDLTCDVDSVPSCPGAFEPNMNNAELLGSQVEVEVISPIETPLYPWMTLTVLAPSKFKVPSNSFAHVVEVRPVDNTCHLLLRCSERPEYKIAGGKSEKEPTPEQSARVSSTVEKYVGQSSQCFARGDSSLQSVPTRQLSDHPNTTEQMSYTDSTFQSKTEVTKNRPNVLDSLLQQSSDNTDSVLEGPFISSVFSLSSVSKNILEGIQWENGPITSPKSSSPKHGTEMMNFPHFSSATPCTEGVKDLKNEDAIESNTCKFPQNVIFESPRKDKERTVIETAAHLTKQEDEKPHESQSLVLPQNKKRTWQKSKLSDKKETDFCSKPQTLFLSCNKNVVMQPLTCVMQNGFKQAPNPIAALRTILNAHQSPDQEKVADHNIKRSHESLSQEKETSPTSSGAPEKPFAKIIKKQSGCQKANGFKPKDKALPKRLPSISSRGTSLQKHRPLRLVPVLANQLTQTPSDSQPVVVLNHPDVDSLEILSVMKIINQFRGNVLNVTLSERMCRQAV